LPGDGGAEHMRSEEKRNLEKEKKRELGGTLVRGVFHPVP